MNNLNLSKIQNDILKCLSDEPITADLIGIEVNRSPGSVRNQCQVLSALNLIKGVPGPKGGYIKIK